jgi:predicted hydrolase (HD superfamily)
MDIDHLGPLIDGLNDLDNPETTEEITKCVEKALEQFGEINTSREKNEILAEFERLPSDEIGRRLATIRTVNMASSDLTKKVQACALIEMLKALERKDLTDLRRRFEHAKNPWAWLNEIENARQSQVMKTVLTGLIGMALLSVMLKLYG